MDYYKKKNLYIQDRQSRSWPHETVPGLVRGARPVDRPVESGRHVQLRIRTAFGCVSSTM